MKDVAANHDQVGSEVHDLRRCALGGGRHVSFTLVDPTGREALILTETEVQVGEVDETHAQS